jgi:hypothetical protein
MSIMAAEDALVTVRTRDNAVRTGANEGKRTWTAL